MRVRDLRAYARDLGLRRISQLNKSELVRVIGEREETYMGDRRMIELKTRDGSLYVYLHNRGFQAPEIVSEAIKFARPRWGDESYALRIIVDQIIKGGRDQLLSYGLMLEPNVEDEYNGNKPSIVVDLVEQTLMVVDPYNDRDGAHLTVTPFGMVVSGVAR